MGRGRPDVRHPLYLAGELVLAVLILVLTGVDSPFFFYTLGTALLGGLVYGYAGAGLFWVMLIVGFAYAIYIRSEFDSTLVDFRTLVVLPALYPIVAVAGAGRGALFDRQAEAEDALADRSARWRRRPSASGSHVTCTTRWPRRCTASAFRRWRCHGGSRSTRRERWRTRASWRGRAHGGAGGARLLPGCVGATTPSSRSRPRSVPRRPAGRAHRDPLGGSLDDVGPLPTLVLRELRWILKEALANVERYAHASRVDVHLRRLGDRVVLTVADDGDGFEAPDDLDSLAGVGSFGLAGMRERARLAGGELSVESEPGDGTVISVWVPAGAPPRQRETPEPPPTAAPSDTRARPGWRDSHGSDPRPARG